MMTGIFLLGGVLLAWAFGRNNFSNVFGSAVGTGILSFKTASFLTGVFLLLGALFNSSGTSETISRLAHFHFLSDSFFFSFIIAVMMLFLTRWGIPASVAQLSVGGLVGWNLALNVPVLWSQIGQIVVGWVYSPLIAFFVAFFVFKGTRFILKKYPVPLLYRDMGVRFLWVLIGSFTAYSLGANNLPVLTVPFVGLIGGPDAFSLLFSLSAGIGCLMASQKVIRMVSSKLFPLSSVESLIVGFSGALTLLLFSFQSGFFPALPISMSASLIGAIVGISFAKGGYGLKGKALFSIIASWFWAPLFSGLLCFGFQTIILARGL
ncbi:MAG: anion permease [Alphaproteobacteria bacterium]